jgi:hypothetical protein
MHAYSASGPPPLTPCTSALVIPAPTHQAIAHAVTTHTHPRVRSWATPTGKAKRRLGSRGEAEVTSHQYAYMTATIVDHAALLLVTWSSFNSHRIIHARLLRKRFPFTHVLHERVDWARPRRHAHAPTRRADPHTQSRH